MPGVGETSSGELGGGLTAGNLGSAVACGGNFSREFCTGATKLSIGAAAVRLGGGHTGVSLALTADGGVLAWGQDLFQMVQEADGGAFCDDAGGGHCLPTPQPMTGLP
jgi:hypothetical protein